MFVADQFGFEERVERLREGSRKCRPWIRPRQQRELGLDVIADLWLVTERKEERKKQLAVAATANRDRVLAFRESQTVKYELRKGAEVLLRTGLRHVREIPTGTDLPAVAAFVGELATWINRDALIEHPTLFAPIAEMLAERMLTAGWPATLVDGAVRHVVRRTI